MNSRALIIIDIQNDYFDGGKNPLVGSKEAALKANSVLEKFRADKELVIHIRHISTRPGSTFFVPGTVGSEIYKDVFPLPEERVIEKNFPNSFRETELKDFLEYHKINTLVICGMMTHMCVDTTVRAAADFGYRCTLISDACATKDLSFEGKIVKADDVNTSFLAALNGLFAKVISAGIFLKETGS